MKFKKKAIKMMILFLFSLVICGYGNMGMMTAKAAAPNLTTKSLTMKVGQEETLQVKDSNAIVKWTSSNKSVVKIKRLSSVNNSKATIVALKGGTAKLKATVGKKDFTVSIKVKALSVKKTVSVKQGKKVTLTVKNAGKKISWSCSNKSIVKIVSTKGSKREKITLLGQKQGKVKLTGKMGSAKFVCTVTVKHTHVYAPATCKDPQRCACGAEKGKPNPLLHRPNMQDATCLADQICTVCGTVLKWHMGHDYVNGICTRCRDVRLEEFFDLRISRECLTGSKTKRVIIEVKNSLMAVNPQMLYIGREEDLVNGNVGTLYTGGVTYQGFLYLDLDDSEPAPYIICAPGVSGDFYFKFMRDDIYIDMNASVTFPIRFMGSNYSVTVTRNGYTYARI